MKQYKMKKGFTVVELLVVIIVIGILASITLVSYRVIQRDAQNAARITAANQIINSIKIYKSYNQGNYPLMAASAVTACIIAPCTNSNGTAETNTDGPALVSALQTVGDVPSRIEDIPQAPQKGIWYRYDPAASYAGDNTKDAYVGYWLEGRDVNCSNPDIAMAPTSGSYWSRSTLGYSDSFTTSTGGKVTICYVSV